MLNNKVLVSVGIWRTAAQTKASKSKVGEATDLFDDVVEENNLCEFHGEVVLVGAWLQVADHGRTYAEGRHQQTGEDEICGGPCLRVHEQQGNIFPGNPL